MALFDVNVGDAIEALTLETLVTQTSTGSVYSFTLDEEPTALSEIWAPTATFERALNESLGALDERVTETFYTRFGTEALDLTEHLDIELIFSVTDNIDVTDQIVADTSYVRDLSDSVSVVDNVTKEADLLFQDTLVITESLIPSTLYVRGDQEAVGVTDAIITELTGEKIVSDTIGILDSPVFIERVFPQDAVSVTDQIIRSTDYTRASDEDAVSLDESASAETYYVRDSSDAVGVTDEVTPVRFQILDVVLSDSSSVTDSVTQEPTKGREANDTISVTDQVTRDGMAFSRFVAEALVLAEEVERSVTFPRTLSDTVSVTDQAIFDTTKGRSAADTITVAEQTVVSSLYERLPTEAIDITETVTAIKSRVYDVVASDAVGIVDTATGESIDVDVELADTIFAITESVLREAIIPRTFSDTISVTDTVLAERAQVDRVLADSATVTDTVSTVTSYVRPLVDNVTVVDTVSVEALTPFPVIVDTDGFGLLVDLPEEVRYDYLQKSGTIRFRPGTGRGVPFQVEYVEPVVSTLTSGNDGATLALGGQNFFSNRFWVPSPTFQAGDVGGYIRIDNGLAPGIYRIISFQDVYNVFLDRPLPLLDQDNGSLDWTLTSAVTGLHVQTSNKITNGANYFFEIQGLLTRGGLPFRYEGEFFTAGIEGPRVESVEVTEDAVVVVTYDQEMRSDREFVLPSEYAITGPTDVEILKAWAVGPSSVALETLGLGEGTYNLSVNYAGTPKDLAGNPIDPVFSEAVFSGTIALKTRSVFTDKGPIAKPPLKIQGGSGAVVNTITEVTLPGATLSSNHVGLYVRLGALGLPGTSSSSVAALNVTASDTVYTPDALKIELITGSITKTTYTTLSGTYKILGVVSATRVRLQASFSLPEPSNGGLFWEVFDPRNGEIADDPADVQVRINGNPIAAQAVIGLLGQVVLEEAPLPEDDVKIDYSFCCNPTVEVRRLNSREFRLNAWNRDSGFNSSPTQHKYRYNNVLVHPGAYAPLSILSQQDQPELRELHYRAYERAYTPVLNDPTLLLLNSPIHRIAFPPAQRTVEEEFVVYEAANLPETDVLPWVRHGAGVAAVAAGVLTVTDDTSGTFPYGQPIFWTRSLDLTFPHAFAMSWRFLVDEVPIADGIFTGICAGYTDESAAYAVGFLDDGGVRKVGFLKRGLGDDPSLITAWTGGLDSAGVPTGAPVELDWTILRSYRIFRDKNGVIRLYVDGNVLETLRIVPNEAPLLEELAAPFNEIQGAFFGSLSRPAENISKWDFVRYLILPTNPLQTSPSSFVSYEATVPPETDSKPWTPIGFHGTETILSNEFLLLDSTSATDVNTALEVGLMGGDFKGFVRMEPLLTSASQVLVDVAVQLRTYTHGVDPYGLMFAVDDGSRLMQVAFLADKATPKVSYGGRSLPEDFSPYVWSALGSASADMVGRILRITDNAVGDGKVYFIEDLAPSSSDDRIIASNTDYFLEFRNRVNTYTVDGSGFAGAFGQIFDGTRVVGILLAQSGSSRFVRLHSDGVVISSFAFDWFDGEYHTYRLAKNTTGDLVSLFIDGTFVGSTAYSSFTAPAPGAAMVSFGSATASSSSALSVVDWAYCNAWRTRSDIKPYVGIWKGYDANALTGYHLPLKASGRNAQVVGNALGDPLANFTTTTVAGDTLIVDYGPNKGVYKVASVGSATALTIVGTWPFGPTLADYRIVRETPWGTIHKYRLTRDSTGDVALLFENDPVPLIHIGYNSIDLPNSGTGVVKVLTDGLAAIAFGSFSPENLEQSYWDFVRYGITRSPTELRIAPHHQVLNQWNVMQSPERLFTALPHELTSYKSSSTGIVPRKNPDFLRDPGLAAFTQLNDSTPLVPSTQTFEVRAPYPVQEYVSVLNSPEDVLNNDGDFTLNDGTVRYRLIVPDDILYTSLDVIEQSTGEESLIAPFGEGCGPQFSGLRYQKEVCLTYDGSTLPENDADAPTPWVRESDVPADVLATVVDGVLTYKTVGSKTVYKNNTTLPDAPGLQTEAKFRLRLVDDATLGTGDTQVRFGLSAPGLTVALAFVTTPLAERYVLAVDLNNGNYLGSISFDFLDGSFHNYRIVRDPGAGVVRVFIDS